MTDDQTYNLLGAAVIGFGAARFQDQTPSSLLLEGRQQLIITLAAEVELLSGLGGALALALAQDEHGQTAADLVLSADGEDACGAGEAEMVFGEGDVHSGASIAGRGRECLIKCGGEWRSKRAAVCK